MHKVPFRMNFYKQKSNHYLFSLSIKLIKLLMISTQRFRPSMEITLSDIFQDFNDPRKEALMRRVSIAMDNLQKRMKNEIQANTLSNLQVLFKKQQALKSMEEKLYQKIEENGQYKQKQLIYNHKFQELQAQMSKKQQLIKSIQKGYEEKYRQITQNYEELKLKSLAKQSVKTTWEQQKIKMIEQNKLLKKQVEELEMQSQKYEVIIKKLKDNFNQKIEESQFLLKIKEQKLVMSHTQSLEMISSLNPIQSKKEAHERLKKQTRAPIFQNQHQNLPKIEKKNQRIQVNLTEVIEFKQNKSKQLSDKEIQTENIQMQINKKIRRTNFEKKQPMIQVQSIRGLKARQQQFYESISPNESKISNYDKKVTVQKCTQTESLFESKIYAKKYNSRSIQVELKNSKLEQAYQFKKRELQQLQQKYYLMQQYHNNHYSQMVKDYEQKSLQDKNIQQKQMLKLNVLELQHSLEKSKEEMAKERQLLIRINDNLSKNQNFNLLNKFSMNLAEKLQFQRRPKIIKSTTISSSKPKRCITTNNSEKNIEGWEDYNNQESMDDTVLLKSKKLYDSQVRVITVINGEANLKTYTEKNSIKSTVNCSQIITQAHKSRNYKKFSQFKKTSPNY